MAEKIIPLEISTDDAVHALEQIAGYAWLLSKWRGGQEFWASDAVAQELQKVGFTGINPEGVTRWFKRLPHTQDFGGYGYHATSEDLIKYFATRRLNSISNDTAQAS